MPFSPPYPIRLKASATGTLYESVSGSAAIAVLNADLLRIAGQWNYLTSPTTGNYVARDVGDPTRDLCAANGLSSPQALTMITAADVVPGALVAYATGETDALARAMWRLCEVRGTATTIRLRYSAPGGGPQRTADLPATRASAIIQATGTRANGTLLFSRGASGTARWFGYRPSSSLLWTAEAPLFGSDAGELGTRSLATGGAWAVCDGDSPETDPWTVYQM